MKNKILIICLFLFTISGYSQEISALEMKSDVEKMASNFKKDNIELNYSKTIFQDKGDATPMEQTNGVYYAGASPNYRLEEKNTLVIQTTTFSMTIDSTEKRIFINKTDKNFSPVNLEMYQNDSVLNAQIFTKRKEKDYLVYTIKSKDTDNGLIEMFVNESTYLIFKINYYFPKGNYFQESMDDESQEQPLLVITYNSIKQKSLNTDLFSTSKWLKSESKPFQKQAFAQDFELIDLRYEPNTSK